MEAGASHRKLTFRKEQVAMSRMMQPRDQMSDLVEKENLRASGAIQDFRQGSAGRSKAEEPLSVMFPGDEEQDRASTLNTPPPPARPLLFWLF